MNGEEIRDKRTTLELSQEEAARKIGVSAATWQRWEKGLHLPSPLAEKKLKRLFTQIHDIEPIT